MKPHSKTLISLLIIVLSFVEIVFATSESFSEELLIKPLPTGHVYSFFQFTTKWDVDPEETKRESAFSKLSSVPKEM